MYAARGKLLLLLQDAVFKGGAGFASTDEVNRA